VAKILPKQPPLYDPRNLPADVRAVIEYERQLYEQLDYLLGQLQQTCADLSDRVAALEKATKE
jgi:hypothetical protein